MKVLLISHTCQSRAEGQVKAECLSRLPDVELRVLIPDRWRHYGHWRSPDAPSSTAFYADIQPVRCPWLGPAQFYLHWYPRLEQTIRDFQPDIIDLWEEAWGLVSVQACRLRSKLLPTAKIISETEQNIARNLPPPFEQFRSYVLRQSDFAIGRSQEAIDVIRRKGYRGPAEVVPNGVDTDVFKPLNREACRRELCVSGFTVGYIGRLVPEKGLIDLLNAMKLCPENVNLILVGTGALREELKSLSRRLGLDRRVRFMLPRPASELPQIFNSLDTLVLPSRTATTWKEQFGRVIIEAHASGVPVIGTSSGAIPSVVSDGGLIVPEASPGELAKAIQTLAADPVLCRRLGAIGQRQVEANYTWGRVAERMHDIYLKVNVLGTPSRDVPPIVDNGSTSPIFS